MKKKPGSNPEFRFFTITPTQTPNPDILTQVAIPPSSG
jgi:hypothetical protein